MRLNSFACKLSRATADSLPNSRAVPDHSRFMQEPDRVLQPLIECCNPSSCGDRQQRLLEAIDLISRYRTVSLQL